MDVSAPAIDWRIGKNEGTDPGWADWPEDPGLIFRVIPADPFDRIY